MTGRSALAPRCAATTGTRGRHTFRCLRRRAAASDRPADRSRETPAAIFSPTSRRASLDPRARETKRRQLCADRSAGKRIAWLNYAAARRGRVPSHVANVLHENRSLSTCACRCCSRHTAAWRDPMPQSVPQCRAATSPFGNRRCVDRGRNSERRLRAPLPFACTIRLDYVGVVESAADGLLPDS